MDLKIYASLIDEVTEKQIYELANHKVYKNMPIRVMPDCHAGKGCTVGTTIDLGKHNYVTPNLTGVDGGCGMLTVKLKNNLVDLERFDKVVHEVIPSGFEVREKPHNFVERYNVRELLGDLHCKDGVNIERAILSIGTLGGGNHFCSLEKSDVGSVYLIIHTGSRNLGVGVCKHYQSMVKYENDGSEERKAIIEKLKAENRHSEIQEAIKKVKVEKPSDLDGITGDNFNDYIQDMTIVQTYADINRLAIAESILTSYYGLSLEEHENFSTIHNYIGDDNILRKGAIAAYKGVKCLIPLNMRDGSLICIGKGNKDWNYSAPHGAGRIMSRNEAKRKVDLADFKETMKDVYSTCVNESTLDESPFAYKSMDDIIPVIKETVDIIERIKPIYNFKAN